MADQISDTETYLLKLAKARKTFSSDWSLSPYVYNRITQWYLTNPLISSTFDQYTISNSRLTLRLLYNYWDSSLTTQLPHRSTPASAGVNTPGRSSIKPLANPTSYVYSSSELVDIMSKREYIYREYFLNKGYIVTLPKLLRASPNNTLLNEVKASFNFADMTSSLINHHHDINYILNGSQSWVSDIFNNFVNTNVVVTDNSDLYKDQFRPMRKGISSMIRLHATGAISMPTEVRVHILASSKDIIHS